MDLDKTIQLYAQVLRQLLPIGGYDTSKNTVIAQDIYGHAKVLAQADLDAKRLLSVLEGFPPELISEYEAEYGLPLKCTVNASRTFEERIGILKWVTQTKNVLNQMYLEQILAIFNVELLNLKVFRPIQCVASCTAPVNTEQLRYKVEIKVRENSAADIYCIIENYLPAFLRYDVVEV